MLTRRDFLRLAVLTAAAGPLSACKKGPKKREINFFNWSNYIADDTLPKFTQETGIAVNYDMYSDEGEMFSKLKAGVQGYDLIVGTDYMIPKLKALQVIDEIPHGELKNLGNVAPRFQNPTFDPGLRFTVPYLWGTTGIGYNKAKFPKAPASWRDLWDPKYAGKMSALDNTRDGIGCALLMLGLPSDAKDPKQLQAARDALLAQKKLLKHYSSSTYIDELVSGEVWLAQGWSGDVLQASKDNKLIEYAIPKEGSFIWVDNLCLIRGSEHREETVALVDYLLRADVAAGIAQAKRYASPNAKAIPLLDAALQKDPRVFPTPDIESRLTFYPLLDPETDDLWNRTWQEVKVM
ncbi:MAG: spermidine/putrescine ABC transporter substrate-binding protein [Elusimicrobia bacterium]|nr:spermidine/putrescine ABC transporter substrate-binding protein [Elusimicrobiota bacterium]